MASNPSSSVFLTPETAKECIDVAGGTPLYAYSLDKLDKFSDDCLAFPNAYGLTVRYAMKACPNAPFSNSSTPRAFTLTPHRVTR